MSIDDDGSSTKSSVHDEFVIVLRGISPSTTIDDVTDFLDRKFSNLFIQIKYFILQSIDSTACQVVDVRFSHDHDNRDRCFVELESESDIRDALKKNLNPINKRPISGKKI